MRGMTGAELQRNRMVVTIVRHGETAYNHSKVIQGHLDIPLNKLGESQARVTARFLAASSAKFDDAFSSDLVRASKTAQIILDGQELLQPLVLDERIRERHLGNLQGKRWGDMGTDASTAEATPLFEGRLLSFWSSLFPFTSTPAPALSQDDEPVPRQILMASHGGSIRQLIAGLLKHEGYVLSLPDHRTEEGTSKRVTNCSITRIEMGQVETPNGDLKWIGRIVNYAEDSHFLDSSRAVSPSANADIID